MTGVTRALTTPRRRRSSVAARRRRSSATALLGAVVAVLALAPSALADTAQSSNWAGYAAHSSRLHFTRVVGTWRQPSALCVAGTSTYSSEWVGLGGYAVTSSALEQIGSELDCSASGKLVSTVWYELVPAPSRNIRMTVAPGDQLAAAVTVTGHQVRLQLSDLTRHTTFSRSVAVHQLDVSSADWIVEAPSECTSASFCQQLALADFGTTAMTRASTQLSTGYRAGIRDPLWRTTAITLSSTAGHFVGSGSGATASADATPSSLALGGSAFAVTYAGAGGSTPASSDPTAQRVRVATLARPGRR
jgi:hypothetical protein